MSIEAKHGGNWHSGGTLMVMEIKALLMRHFNITPDGQEEIAVRADYGREA